MTGVPTTPPPTTPAPPVTAALSRRKQAAFTAILAGFSLALCLLVAGGYYTVVGHRLHRQHQAEFAGRSFIQHDPLIGYAARPAVTMQHLTPPVFAIYTDDRGCRTDAPGQAAPTAVDLLAIGCSFTFGFGVDNPATYVSRVGRDLGLTAGNVALPAYGTAAALKSLERYGDLAPKVVVYGFIGTHLTRNLLPCATTNEPFCRPVAFVDTRGGQPTLVAPRLPTADQDRYLTDTLVTHGFGWRDVYWAIRQDWMTLRGQTAAAVNAPYEAQAADPAARATALRFLMDELVGATQDRHSRLVVAYIPIPGDVQPMPAELAAALADHPELPVADLSAAFTDYEARHGQLSLRVSADDAHPNAAAHALVASAVAPLVAAALTPTPPGATNDSAAGTGR